MAYPEWDNFTNFGQMLDHVNFNYTQGFLFIGILFVIYIVVIVKYLRNGDLFHEAIFTGGLINLILSMLLWIGGFVTARVVIIFGVLTALGGLVTYLTTSEKE